MSELEKNLNSWGFYARIVVVGLIAVFFLSIMNNSIKNGDKLAGSTVSSMNNSGKSVLLKTNMGDIKINLFETETPKTVNNFVKLAEAGFYDGTKFHRVIKDFMIQGGDPLSKEDLMKDMWGTGGPGYTFEDEISADNSNLTGTISMANAGPNTNGSQFFINLADNNFLNDKHTVFGKVVEGFDIVQKIGAVKTLGAPTDRPVDDVIIEKIVLQ